MKIIITILFVLSFFLPQSKNDWIMYPNPTKDYFNVEVKEGTLPQFIRIYDMNGRLLQTENIGKGQTFYRVDIHLKSGKYIVYMEDK